MLEQYYVRPETVDRICGSWIGEPVERYVAWLAERGYAASTVLRRVPMLEPLRGTADHVATLIDESETAGELLDRLGQ